MALTMEQKALLDWAARNGQWWKLVEAIDSMLTSEEEAPHSVRSVSTANVSIPTSSGVWAAIDPNGSAPSRPLDLVLSNMKAGQTILVGFHARITSTGADMYSMATVNEAGAIVNLVHDSAYVTAGTEFTTATSLGRSMVLPYVLQAADIVNGSVRIRPVHLGGAATLVSTGGSPIYVNTFWATGPF